MMLFTKENVHNNSNFQNLYHLSLLLSDYHNGVLLEEDFKNHHGNLVSQIKKTQIQADLQTTRILPKTFTNKTG